MKFLIITLITFLSLLTLSLTSVASASAAMGTEIQNGFTITDSNISVEGPFIVVNLKWSRNGTVSDLDFFMATIKSVNNSGVFFPIRNLSVEDHKLKNASAITTVIRLPVAELTKNSTLVLELAGANISTAFVSWFVLEFDKASSDLYDLEIRDVL